MRSRSAQVLMIVLALVLVLGFAGCGGKKKAASTTTTTTTTAVTSPETTTSAAAGATAQQTTTPSGLGSLGSLANCKQLADLGAAFASALQGAQGDFQKEQQLLQQFAAKTPSDIRPDFETLANAVSKLVTAIKGKGGTPNLAKLTQLAQQLNSPALQKAEAHIEAWAKRNCHA